MMLDKKSLSNISRCVLESADESNLSRFLSESPWSGQEVNDCWVKYMVKQTEVHQRPAKDSCLIVDDTLCESAPKVIQLYLRRWPIETFYQDSRGHLGLDEYRMRTAEAFQKHWCLMFVAYSILHLECRPASSLTRQLLTHHQNHWRSVSTTKPNPDSKTDSQNSGPDATRKICQGGLYSFVCQTTIRLGRLNSLPASLKTQQSSLNFFFVVSYSEIRSLLVTFDRNRKLHFYNLFRWDELTHLCQDWFRASIYVLEHRLPDWKHLQSILGSASSCLFSRFWLGFQTSLLLKILDQDLVRTNLIPAFSTQGWG